MRAPWLRSMSTEESESDRRSAGEELKRGRERKADGTRARSTQRGSAAVGPQQRCDDR